MKKVNLLAICISLIFGAILFQYQPVQSHNYGAPTGVAGDPASGGATCRTCHTSYPEVTQAGLISTNIPVSGYVPGTNYVVTGTVYSPVRTRFGFEITAQNPSGTLLGTDSISSPTTTAAAGTGYVTHKNTAINFPGHTATWSFVWKAPAAGSGPVTFYGAFIVSDGNTGASGDSVRKSSLTVNEAVVAPVASVSISTSSTTVCAGSSVTFTATPTNGGSAPSYQWKIGTTNVGTNSPTFTTTALTNGQVVTCVMTSNLSGVTGSPATSNAITMTVNPSVTPSVSIATASTSVCAGSSVTFTATPTNGGTTPSYQWKVGTTNVGTNSPTYTTTTLTNGQVVSCVMTSNATCASPTTATSNSITMTVNPAVTPSVSIATASTSVCAGASVTFTATPTNGGTTPSYQWKVGTTNVGTNSPTYTTTALTNGQVVSCVMTSNAACASSTTATSNSITMTVNPYVMPTVSIASSGNNICAGSSVTFTATPTNGGTTPSYQWKVGTFNVGTNSPTYTTTALTNGQAVTCVMTSSAACPSPASTTSNTITMTVNPSVTPSVSIATASSTICAGSSITFTATPTNGGSSPSYQWKVGTTNVGTNSPTYTTTALTNGQVVSCVMTSNAACASSSTATSNSITVTVNPLVGPSVSISTSSSSICVGGSATFTATPTNGGSAPSYQWKVGSTNVGTNSPTFTSSSLNNGDVVSCTMTSNAACASPTVANSNQITMSVSSIVTPSVSISTPNNSICSGTSVTFTASGNGGGSNPSYQWYVNTTPVGTNSATYTSSSLTNGQSVSCVLTSSSSCASPTTATSNSINMTVNPAVTPTVAISITGGSNPACAGAPITFTATETNGGFSPVFAWYVNTTPVGTNSSSYTSSSLTSGQVVTCRLTSSASCASPVTVTSGGIAMSITPTVTPTISISAPRAAICSGTSITFTSSVTNGGTNAHYDWYLNGAAVDSSVAYTVDTLTLSSTISCTLTSSATCASPASVSSNNIQMTVNPLPFAAIYPSGPITICSGDSAPLMGVGGLHYQWSTGDTITTLQVKQAGTYTLTATDANGCSAVANLPSVVSVSTVAVPTVSQSGNTLSSSVATTYQWYINDSLIPSDTTQTITINQGGQYSVKVTDGGFCSATSIKYIATPLGVYDIDPAAQIHLYPVPNRGSFVIESSTGSGDLQITDIYGKVVFYQKLNAAKQEVNATDLAPALYFVTVTEQGRSQTIKMEVTKE